MSQLCSIKSGFLLCIMISIYLLFNNIKHFKELMDEKGNNEVIECGYYPAELCKALFEGKPAALIVGNVCQEALPPSNDQGLRYLQLPTNCSEIIKEMHIITKPLSEEEANFHLAYIITIHKKLQMFVKLLTAIYAPQNVYCIHIDKKAPKTYKNAVYTIASCFQNIIISSKQENVVYGGFSRLKADINCMEDLIRSKTPWSYVINVCGQDYPIKTNKEIIKYLKSKWRGRNVTPGTIQPPHMKYRTEVSYKEFLNQGKPYICPSSILKNRPPHNLTLYFGTAYYALTRDFVEFVLSDIRAKDLLEWSKDTYSPDEHYWVTLNHLKDAPGSTPDAQWEGNIRAVKWKDQEGKAHPGCNGHYIRDICVYGLGDLKWLMESPHLFANKFDPEHYPLLTDCLERQYRLKVLQEAEVAIEKNWHFQDDVFNIKEKV
ncbi:beta-1,3-galactosyl-O-glycosyl-glycoprotein beta-1,6-N-acetylglucosaminyltransferase 7-like [Bombina bombina]|uniref:beta-1,3-galactosyl-O-glycosyl-glycoprotein beta-1,6-N-acetylglucosaminyltransferase 7-like n=1 Tax=Bombina bombina TaxID=8345 RepID=UPI00235A94D9|nr:beta-1,3-galactosyl-O-glycosyl-glycoprotein beta-1,6-N-acetylglucosaminyltransferase 7-like [Bombina bombina]